MMNSIKAILYDIKYFGSLSFLRILGKVNVEVVAESVATKIIYDNWADKAMISEAVKKKDWVKVAQLVQTIRVETELDEDEYYSFLHKVLIGEIIWFIIITIVALILFRIIGGIIR